MKDRSFKVLSAQKTDGGWNQFQEWKIYYYK